MRNGTKDLFAVVLERQVFQQRFKARLVLDVQNFLQRADLFFRESHSVDDPAEEVHTTEVDLKSLNAEPLECFNGNQQDFNVGRFSGATVVFDSDLRKFPLPSALRFFEAQDFAGIEKPNRFWR